MHLCQRGAMTAMEVDCQRLALICCVTQEERRERGLHKSGMQGGLQGGEGPRWASLSASLAEPWPCVPAAGAEVKAPTLMAGPPPVVGQH